MCVAICSVALHETPAVGWPTADVPAAAKGGPAWRVAPSGPTGPKIWRPADMVVVAKRLAAMMTTPAATPSRTPRRRQRASRCRVDRPRFDGRDGTRATGDPCDISGLDIAIGGSPAEGRYR
jgi:hypothetical protein